MQSTAEGVDLGYLQLIMAEAAQSLPDLTQVFITAQCVC